MPKKHPKSKKGGLEVLEPETVIKPPETTLEKPVVEEEEEEE